MRMVFWRILVGKKNPGEVWVFKDEPKGRFNIGQPGRFYIENFLCVLYQAAFDILPMRWAIFVFIRNKILTEAATATSCQMSFCWIDSAKRNPFRSALLSAVDSSRAQDSHLCWFNRKLRTVVVGMSVYHHCLLPVSLSVTSRSKTFFATSLVSPSSSLSLSSSFPFLSS